ncbi:MAG: nucleoside-triphosphatase [Candidatus Bipolaricaulia bacterium]
MKILLTGRVGVGKTTALNRTLALLGIEPGGFRTERYWLISEGLQGYRIVDLASGRAALIGKVLASGRVIPCPQGFEEVGVEALQRALEREFELIVMDELGFLELGAPRFQGEVFAALRSSKPVLGAIKPIHNPFLDAIRALPGLKVIEVQEESRDRLPFEIAKLLGMEALTGRLR